MAKRAVRQVIGFAMSVATVVMMASPAEAGQVYRDQVDGVSGLPPQGATAACLDSDYDLTGFGAPSSTEQDYYINTSSRPSGMSESQLVARVEDSLNTWNTTYTDCTYSDISSLDYDYLGTTTATVDPSSYSTDGYNTVSFVDVGTCTSTSCPKLGQVLIHRTSGVVDEWEIVLHYDATWFTGSNPASIGSSEFDLQSIVTHEGGHVSGIAHNNPTGCSNTLDDIHWYLTMFGCTAVGETFRRTLGLGDILALEQVA